MLSRSGMSNSFATPPTEAHQAPLSVGFSRQEYWSGLPLTPPGDLPDPGMEPMSSASPALAGWFFTTKPRGESSKNWFINALQVCLGSWLCARLLAILAFTVQLGRGTQNTQLRMWEELQYTERSDLVYWGLRKDSQSKCWLIWDLKMERN